MISLLEQLKILKDYCQDQPPDKNYSIDESNPESIGRDYRKLIICPKLRNLIDRNLCAIGDGPAYENNCLELVREMLSSDFAGSLPVHNPRTLLSGNSQVKIRDITIKVPQHGLASHWLTMIHEYCDDNNHRYCIRSIIFECKNYKLSTKIRSKQIYQLFEYLNPGKYGKFGVILSRFGVKQLSNDAKIAIRRLLLDDYRIIILGDDEVSEWIDLYEKTGSSETFFAKCADKTNAYLL